jgi:hypothetical protein
MRFDVALVIGLLASSAAAKSHVVQLTSTFNAAEVAWSQRQGTNTIHGSAVLRTVGGDAKTCAGLDANLVPMSAYANERMAAMFGAGTAVGILRANSELRFSSTDPAYVSTARKTVCDPQGYFVFEKVPDGEYFLTAFVTWGVPGRYFTRQEGGVLMQRITVHGSETKTIVLTAP